MQHSFLERWVKLHCVFLQYCFKNKFENSRYYCRSRDFLRKNFVFNSQSTRPIVTKLSHHTMWSVTISCVKYRGWMHRTSRNKVRCQMSHARCGQVCLIVCTSLGHITCDAIAVCHGIQRFYAFGANF